MVLLDANACQTVCSALGPFGEVIMLIAAGALAWWKSRQATTAKTQAQVARVEAEAAKGEVQRLHVLSMRAPPMPTLLPPSSSASGTFAPVVMPDLPAGAPKPRPSMPDPSLTGDEALPPPPKMPPSDPRAVEARDDDATIPARPGAKRGP